MTGTFEGVGTLQFSPDNKYGYAYSGVHDIGDTETNLLLFSTESFYLKGTVQFNYVELNGYHFRYRLYLNNVIVQGFVEPSGSSGDPNATLNLIPIIIPPFTIVKCTAQNLTDATLQQQVCSITGKVGGAIEQENLESITDNNKWASL